MKNIVISSKDIPVSNPIRERIESRFQRLERMNVPLITPHVTIIKERQGTAIEASVTIPNGKLFAQSNHEDLYAAITDMGQKLERQLKRYAHKPHAHRSSRSGKEQCREGAISGVENPLAA